ncbi:hypothetical protein ACVWWK_002342 [Bradyrhizobium sp. LB9.1b]
MRSTETVIAFGLAVELRKHRPDALDPLDQPARRHRGGAIEHELERGEVGLAQRGMIEQHVDHGGHEQCEIDPLARDGGQYRLGIKTLQHVDGAAAHQGRQHLCARDMADRSDRQIARRLWNFEVGEDRTCRPAVLAMIAQRALGFSGRPAGVVQCREIVGAGEAQRGGVAFDLDRLQQVDAIVGRSHGEDRLELPRLCGELAAALAEGGRIDHQHLGPGILELEELVSSRPQRMQPGDAEPGQLRGDTGAPGVGAIGGEESDTRAGLQSKAHEYALDASDQVDCALIAQRSAGPGESGAARIARQCP